MPLACQVVLSFFSCFFSLCCVPPLRQLRVHKQINTQLWASKGQGLSAKCRRNATPTSAERRAHTSQRTTRRRRPHSSLCKTCFPLGFLSFWEFLLLLALLLVLAFFVGCHATTWIVATFGFYCHAVVPARSWSLRLWPLRLLTLRPTLFYLVDKLLGNSLRTSPLSLLA